MNYFERKLSAIIFDLDGTLLTSNLDFIAMKSQLGCPQQQDLLCHIAELGERQQLRANHIVVQHEMLDAQQSNWIAGAQQCVSWLVEQQVPLAIVTRNCQQAVAVKLSKNAVPINLVLTREDCPPKPDPTGLLSIANAWGIEPKHIAYVGDYLYDLQAAKNAGMLACLYVEGEEPSYVKQADYVFSEYKQLIRVIKTALIPNSV